VAVGAAAVIAQVGLAAMPAPAQSPAATITSISSVSGTAGVNGAAGATVVDGTETERPDVSVTVLTAKVTERLTSLRRGRTKLFSDHACG